ncbi:MAG: cell envelope integrity protein CreD [Gammaproteobacteria bacterium]
MLILLAVFIGFVLIIYLLVRKFLKIEAADMDKVKGAYKGALKNMNQTLTVRGIIIGIIALVMLIPLAMFEGVVHERNGLYQNVLHDIANTWGGQQTLQAPILVVPFIEEHISKETTTDENYREKTKTKTKYLTRYAVHLPKDLKIDVDLLEEHRKRGIYDSLVYKADILVSGSFEKLNIEAMSDHIYRIDWDKAFVILGLSDTRAINDVTPLVWDDVENGFNSGTQLTSLLEYGFHARLPEFDANKDKHEFSTKISVNGSKGFRFAPFGENTTVAMNSSWPHPSFQGMTLPSEYKIKDDGFTSTWSIPHLARNFPQSWLASSKTYNLNEFTAGVDLFEPVFLYSKVTRAVKYGILFVGLTFLTFLIFELTMKEKLHFVQYGLIGIALSLFYLVLLSVAEHTAFLTAYIIAAAINVGLITLYTAAALKSWSRAGVIFVLLGTLYTVLYSLLQLEDYALLMGTILLLSVLMILMYVTRNLRVNASDSSQIPHLGNG